MKSRHLEIANAGGIKMAEFEREAYEKEMISLRKAFMGFFFGTGAVLCIWLLSGLYVILH